MGDVTSCFVVFKQPSYHDSNGLKKHIVEEGIVRRILMLLIAAILNVSCGSGSPTSTPVVTPGQLPPGFAGMQLGGGSEASTGTGRPPAPRDACWQSGGQIQGPTTPPTPFLYQPFAGVFSEAVWAAQMDHASPNYQSDGTIATLGEILTPNPKGVGLAGGAEAYDNNARQRRRFDRNTSVDSLRKQGFALFAYQSPALESYQYYDGHDGHDFAVTGDALAAADGKVSFKGNDGLLGRVAEITHPQGYLTRYAHLAGFADGIEVGAAVKAGQPVGKIGGSALVNGKLDDKFWGVHLHFAVFRWNAARKAWQVTDPFGWDPWAGPTEAKRQQKQREDPLAGCNGEVSYPLWVDEWPRLPNSSKSAQAVHPTQDRYVGGWLGAESQASQSASPVPSTSSGSKTAAPLSKNTLPVTVVPYDYQSRDAGEGWQMAALCLAFVNDSGKPIPPAKITAKNAFIETRENKTYPADLVDPTVWYEGGIGRDNFLSYVREGRYRWDSPKDIYLGEAAIGGKLPIPVGLPFVNAPAGFGSYTYGLVFRYAQAATPVRAIIETAEYGNLVLDLSRADQQFTDPTANFIGARPLAELKQDLVVNNEKVEFSWDGTCVWRIEEMVRNKMVYLPYRLKNKNALDQTDFTLPFPHAVYGPGGALSYWEEEDVLSIGPGQQLQDLYLIDLLISESDPLPLFLVYYPPNAAPKVYQLACDPYRQ